MKVIKGGRLGWLVYLFRMQKHDRCKKLTFCEPENTGGGKYAIGWLDSTEDT